MIEQLKERARRAGLRRFWKPKPVPTNFQMPDRAPAAIASAVDYAVANGRAYAERLNTLGIKIADAKVLEIGPGPAFGSMAYLRSRGADVCVADRWLAPWNADYHNLFYAALAERLKKEEPAADTDFLRRIVSRNAYDDDAIGLVHRGAEDLAGISDRSVDAIFSNAVLEHLADPQTAFDELFRITKPGGAGVHQVDYRDHRDFDNPLDHLLFDANTFAQISEKVNTEYGSQLRQPDYAFLLTGAGFEIESYSSNCRADDAYLDTLEKRLRRSARSAYRDCPRSVLADLSGQFIVRRGA